MQILINSVKIPDRVRKDLGDLQPLMDSLRRCGQLNPVTVSRDMVLIAGHRRVEAATQLGWRMIDAMVVDGIDEIRRLEIELEENIHRKDFSPEELLDGVRRLDRLRRPKPMKRLANAVRKAVSALAFWRYFGKRAGPDAESPVLINDSVPNLDAPSEPDPADEQARRSFRFGRPRRVSVPSDESGEEALGI